MAAMLVAYQTPANADEWQVIRDDAASSQTTTEIPPFRTQETAPDPRLKIGRIIDDCRQMKTLPVGYQADGVEFTSAGLRLAKGATQGTFYSPAIQLMQPSNAAVPRWRADVPASAGFVVGICMSADGINWTRWISRNQKTALGEAGAETPAGTEPWLEGAMIAHGFRLYNFIRYRMILAGSDTNSPVVERVMMWHNDSTEGQGYEATLDRVAKDEKEAQTTKSVSRNADIGIIPPR